MVVVDSSGWIEFLSGGPKAQAYAAYLKDPERIVTPTIVLYEVYKKLKREMGEDVADLCLGRMKKTRLVPLDDDLAIAAAELSLEFSLAMADAFILATARAFQAELITSDADFQKVPGARVL